MDRRSFLKLMAGATAGLSAGVCSKETSLIAAGPDWGVPPPELAPLMIPAHNQPEGVLEMYLMGGLNPWDTFYTVPEFGKGTQWMYNTFLEGERSIEDYFDICKGPPGDMYRHFGTDAAGVDVHLGPWLYPLWERQDILDRTRIMVLRHNFEPHGVASPLALTGHPRGFAQMTAQGAHVERFHRQLEPSRLSPQAYVLYSLDSEIAAQFDIHTASATGLHPASYTPLAVRMVPNNPLPDQLGRTHLGGYAGAVDAAMDQYIEAYRGMLRPRDFDLLLKARAFDEMSTVRHLMRNSQELLGILTRDVLVEVDGAECGVDTAHDDYAGVYDTTQMGLTLARSLLTRHVDRARHVTLIDSGLVNASGAGYDTHDDHVVESSRNVVHTARLLAESINAPGENDPTKLDLDRHTILITSEFGRTPYVETGKEFGLDHWPFGYVVVAIGGFVGKDQKGIVGAIGESGQGATWFSPQEFRAAALMGMGIWPFSKEAFALEKGRPGENRGERGSFLRQHLLGYEL